MCLRPAAQLASLPPYLNVQLVRFFYKADVQQKAKILRKVRCERGAAKAAREWRLHGCGRSDDDVAASLYAAPPASRPACCSVAMLKIKPFFNLLNPAWLCISSN